LADAAFLAMDCARQQLGLMAMEPPNDDMASGFRKQVTFQSLKNALSNSEAVLID